MKHVSDPALLRAAAALEHGGFTGVRGSASSMAEEILLGHGELLVRLLLDRGHRTVLVSNPSADPEWFDINLVRAVLERLSDFGEPVTFEQQHAYLRSHAEQIRRGLASDGFIRDLDARGRDRAIALFGEDVFEDEAGADTDPPRR